MIAACRKWWRTLFAPPVRKKTGRVICVTGSTFAPPTLGHQEVFRVLASCGLFDEVWVYAAATYKKPWTTAMHRLNMARFAFPTRWTTKPRQGWAPVFLETSHVLLPMNPPTAETMLKLQKEFPEDTFVFVVGSDVLRSKEEGMPIELLTWGMQEELRKLHIIIMPRQGFPQPGEVELPAEFEHIEWFPLKRVIPDIQSTKVREHVLSGKRLPIWGPPKKRMVRKDVRDYIRTHQPFTQATPDERKAS